MKGEFNRLLIAVRREMGIDTADLLERYVTEYLTQDITFAHTPYILRGILYTIRTATPERSMAAYYATMCLNRMNDFEWRCSHL